MVEERFTRDEMYVAEEVFVTGTAAELTPVTEIDQRRIGTGRPGQITQTLQKAFFEVVGGGFRSPAMAHPSSRVAPQALFPNQYSNT